MYVFLFAMNYNQHSFKNQPSSVKVELLIFPPKHLLKQIVGEDSFKLDIL